MVDVPPWPDTVMPAAEFLQRLGIKSKNVQGRFQGSSWQWSTMDYYTGQESRPARQGDALRIPGAPALPWQIKAVWAHHRYVVAEVQESFLVQSFLVQLMDIEREHEWHRGGIDQR